MLNLDHKSKKTRISLRHNILRKEQIKILIEKNPETILWNYDPKTDTYMKVTAEVERNTPVLKDPKAELQNYKIILKDQKHNVVKIIEKDIKDNITDYTALFKDKKIMLSYQRSPKIKTKTKKDLLREALGPKELKEVFKTGKKTVWGFDELEQKYQEYTLFLEEELIVLKNKENKIEKFIDAIFKTESEVKTYRDTSFM